MPTASSAAVGSQSTWGLGPSAVLLTQPGQPIITANWEAASGNQWVVPFGGGVGKIFRLGKLPFNGGVSAFYDAVKPEFGPDWTLRIQLALLLPKSIL